MSQLRALRLMWCCGCCWGQWNESRWYLEETECMPIGRSEANVLKLNNWNILSSLVLFIFIVQHTHNTHYVLEDVNFRRTIDPNKSKWFTFTSSDPESLINKKFVIIIFIEWLISILLISLRCAVNCCNRILCVGNIRASYPSQCVCLLACPAGLNRWKRTHHNRKTVLIIFIWRFMPALHNMSLLGLRTALPQSFFFSQHNPWLSRKKKQIRTIFNWMGWYDMPADVECEINGCEPDEGVRRMILFVYK